MRLLSGLLKNRTRQAEKQGVGSEVRLFIKFLHINASGTQTMKHDETMMLAFESHSQLGFGITFLRARIEPNFDCHFLFN